MSEAILGELVSEVRGLRRQVKRQGKAASIEKKLLCKLEVARLLRVNIHTLYAIIASRQLAVVQCGGAEKIRADDVAVLIRDGWKRPELAPKRPRPPKAALPPGPQTAGELAAAIRGL